MRFRWLLLLSVLLIGAIACSSSTDGETPQASPTASGDVVTGGSATARVVLLSPTSTPASEWGSVAPMHVGRTSYSATLLNDGRVLVVGGLGDEGVLRSTEIYDPESDTWTVAADTIHPRRDSVLVTLSDGRVVVAGGVDSVTVSTSEIFDPESNQWTELPPLNVGRESAMSVALDDGRMLVFGGENTVIGAADGGFMLRSAEIYDPNLNEWKLVEPIAQGEMTWEGWTKLTDGRVLLVGGDFARPNRFVQMFNPAADSWRLLEELETPNGGSAVTLLPDGNVLVSGGGLRCCLTESHVLDINTEEWSVESEMLVQRGGHIGLNLPDGRTVLLFGLNPDFPFDDPYRGGEIFDPASGQRELLPDFPGIFDVINATVVLDDGRVFLAGGRFAQIEADGTFTVDYSADAFLLRPPEK